MLRFPLGDSHRRGRDSGHAHWSRVCDFTAIFQWTQLRNLGGISHACVVSGPLCRTFCQAAYRQPAAGPNLTRHPAQLDLHAAGSAFPILAVLYLAGGISAKNTRRLPLWRGGERAHHQYDRQFLPSSTISRRRSPVDQRISCPLSSSRTVGVPQRVRSWPVDVDRSRR